MRENIQRFGSFLAAILHYIVTMARLLIDLNYLKRRVYSENKGIIRVLNMSCSEILCAAGNQAAGSRLRYQWQMGDPLPSPRSEP
jgi:hypothetical protein